MDSTTQPLVEAYDGEIEAILALYETLTAEERERVMREFVKALMEKWEK